MPPTRREFLKTLGLGLTAGSSALASSLCRKGPAGDRPPNIVLIFIDDMGYADLGCFGAKGYETPRIDRLATEGIRLTDFYVSQAVCGASRASLMTGCYAERVGYQGAPGPASKIGLHLDEETIAEVLKKRGYATAIFGKWHLGCVPEFYPTRQGFDEYLGLLYSNDMWAYGYDGAPATSGAKANHPPLMLMRNEEPVTEIKTLEDQSTLTERYTREALRFIDENKDRPFFLYLPHSMVHTPVAASPEFRGKSGHSPYADAVMELDASTGRIMDRLERYGLGGNTVVIFTSDNGPWLNFGAHAGSAGPLREGKGTMFEGGPRVPCIIRWPGRIQAGRVTSEIASTIDLLPTIASWAGASLPSRPIDGLDLGPLLEGRTRTGPRDHFFYYYGHELRAVRKGRWKLIFPHKSRSYAGVEPGRGGLPGPYASVETGLELYDLVGDIGETCDVAAEHPDIVAELQELAEKAREELGDHLTGRKGKGEREPGRLSTGFPSNVSHLGVGAAVSYVHPPSFRFLGDGPSTLTDGKRGTLDFHDGRWLGFEGDDFEAVIDLGREVSVSSVSCGFLQNQQSWIFMPTEVGVYLSRDGISYREAGRISRETARDEEAAYRPDELLFPPASARYIRVRARNVGVCPSWHPGSGGNCWIFIDEIVVS
jgi:arylsulfatase A-like enzyme